MLISHLQLRKLFKDFWESKDHKEIPPISLIPQDDPTTLFTGSGMQQLVPYLLGETHPLGKRLYNIQPCLRTQDIEEVGDNRHTTFFEMMGNWSLGDYFKKEQLTWFWEFITQVLGLKKEKLFVTVFAGDKKNNLPADTESIEIWKNLGIKEDHIFKYGPEKNWWSRAGIPENMPSGEPGGPDSEVFYEFTDVQHDEKFGKKCHPNCECGRFMEIGNSVFMEYKKTDGGFVALPNKNVDFGGGLERILTALNNNPDVFTTDLYYPIVQSIEIISHKNYEKRENAEKMRVIADHLKAASLLIKMDIFPSNKERGYFLRRLLRRVVVKILKLKQSSSINANELSPIIKKIVAIYQDIYFEKNDDKKIQLVIEEEINRFNKTLNKGMAILEKITNPTGKQIFDLYQTYGFPKELSEELLRERGLKFDKSQFNEEFEKHRLLSRQASAGMFKGGLADKSEQTIKFHTATHLINQALSDVLGDKVRQEGSNITSKRLRFDFYYPYKISQEQIKKVENIVKQKIDESLSVYFKIIPKEEAYKIGAKSFFREKYPDMVKVYFIGNYSKELCGGPHVTNTKEIKQIKIFKFEKIGNSIYRIYAK